MSFYRLTQVYLENSNHSFKHDYKDFKSENHKSVNLDKKVFLLIFDEFEQKYFKKHYNQLTNLKKLHQHVQLNPLELTDFEQQKLLAVFFVTYLKNKLQPLK